MKRFLWLLRDEFRCLSDNTYRKKDVPLLLYLSYFNDVFLQFQGLLGFDDGIWSLNYLMFEMTAS